MLLFWVGGGSGGWRVLVRSHLHFDHYRKSLASQDHCSRDAERRPAPQTEHLPPLKCNDFEPRKKKTNVKSYLVVRLFTLTTLTSPRSANTHPHTHTPQPANPVDAAERGRHLHNTTKLISPSPAVLESREDENIRRRCPEHGIIIEDLRSLLVSN